MRKMNNRTIGLVAAALVLVACIGVGSALAYFTTYTVAEGGMNIVLNFSDSEIEEKVIDGQKQIALKNTGDTEAYVRIKALVGDDHPVVYSEPSETNGSWKVNADGYYYYEAILAPGESTTQINVGFSLEGKESFNVIIVEESTPVLYDENGNAYADWSVKADIAQSVVPVE